MEVRDPIHGGIPIAPDEVPIVDHPFVQRLRNIKQMGFSELPFPGAVHSRYIHSVGAMHLAGRAFDLAFEQRNPARKQAWRQCLRLAALLHDVGHAPFSHCTEFAMPPVSTLGIKVYGPQPDRRASHEDYTVGVLTLSDLAAEIDARFPFTARHVAALVSRDVECDDDFFVEGGLDHRAVLSQIISSELDIDRLDYLVRDSYFSGARYGQVDVNWLLSCLRVHEGDNRLSLALDRRGIYAFDDFMVARYHMFVMVYFHHKSVVFEEMLKRYFASPECSYSLPSDMASYLDVDDIQLHAHLRAAPSQWAQDIVRRRAWRRVLEKHGPDVDLSDFESRLREAGVDFLGASSVGKLSRYAAFGQKRDSAPPLYVVGDALGRASVAEPLYKATAIFQRYEDERRLARIYVAPSDEARARKLLGQS